MPGQVEHLTRRLEESERAMQERVQRLEASRLSLEEVSTCQLGARLCLSLGHPFCRSEPLQARPSPRPPSPRVQDQYLREARGTFLRWDVGPLGRGNSWDTLRRLVRGTPGPVAGWGHRGPWLGAGE